MCDTNDKEFLRLRNKAEIVGISGLTLEEEFRFKNFQKLNKFQGEINYDKSSSGEFNRFFYSER
jgi:hypothetical protein